MKISRYEAIENLKQLNVHELQEESERFNITNTNDMTKSELIEAIISESEKCNLIKKTIKGFIMFDYEYTFISFKKIAGIYIIQK